MKRPVSLALCLSALSAISSTTAQAAGPEITSDVPSEPSGKQRPLWELGLGVAGLRLPDYLSLIHI